MISVSIDLNRLRKDIDEAEDTGGAFNPDQVYFQFICTTNDATGAHDPHASPAPHVRPAHAALHGTVWRLDDPRAPIPPLDYGCRCAMSYCAAPKTLAARALPEAPQEPETSPAAPAKRWLKANVDGWEDMAKDASMDLARLVDILKGKSVADARDVAALIISVLRK